MSFNLAYFLTSLIYDSEFHVGVCSLVELRSPALGAKKAGLVSFLSSNFGLIRSVWKKMDIKLLLYLVDVFPILSNYSF